MRTKTKFKDFWDPSQLCDWIDRMYAKHGKQIINVSTAASNTCYCGFITILQSQEQINID